ncbi:MAG TPA: hypothetical protein VKY74_09855 [Chloroflexia bacterium]|nr:hypothetical protein [Chloroflexia bacterium]
MKTKGSIVVVAVATLMGLFFGNAMGSVVADLTQTTIKKGQFDYQSLIMAIILGGVAAFAAYRAVSRYEPAATSPTPPQTIPDPPLARFLFADPRAAALWLPIRLYVGWDWLEAGLHKAIPSAFIDAKTGLASTSPSWFNSSAGILGFWKNGVGSASSAGLANYDWWKGFLQMLIDSHADVWFSKLIVCGEIAVGLGLITGALVGLAAAGGMLMNLSFMLSGSTSSNPVLAVLAILLIMAWKVAGYAGLDRVLLPMLGTPWQPGKLVRHAPAVAPLRS